MAFTPINIGNSSKSDFTPITFDQSKNALGGVQQIAQQQIKQPAAVGSAGEAQQPSLTTAQKISEIPAEGTSLARTITSKLGLGKAVDVVSNSMANIGNLLNPTTSLAQKEQTQQELPHSNPIDAAEAGAEIGLTVPAPEGGAAVDVTRAVEKVAGDLAAKSAEKKATQTAIKALTPKMTASELSEAAAAGKGVVPKVGAPGISMSKDSGFMKMVNATKDIIKGKSPIQDINNVRSALSTEAESLKSKIAQGGKDIIFPFKELASKIDSAAEPISLKGTSFEKQIGPLKEAAIKMAQKAGGNISGLLDARKEFDALVNKTWPTLFDSDHAPMKGAVTAVRNAMNDFIEDNLPDAGYKASLETQKTFYNAIDNLSTKVPDEIKGSDTFAKRHPKTVGLAQNLGKGALYIAGADVVNETAKKIGLPSL